MVYLLLFLAAVLVIGPVLWMRPSPREKLLTQLRQFAFQQKLRVSVPSKDDLKWLPKSDAIESYRVVRYSVSINHDDRDSQILMKNLGRYYYEAGHWRSVEKHLDPPPLAEALAATLGGLIVEDESINSARPTVVDFVEIQRGFVAVYWQEQPLPGMDNAQLVATIAEALKGLQNQLAQ